MIFENPDHEDFKYKKHTITYEDLMYEYDKVVFINIKTNPLVFRCELFI